MVNFEDKDYKDKTKKQKQDYINKLIVNAESKVNDIDNQRQIIDDYMANLKVKKPK